MADMLPGMHIQHALGGTWLPWIELLLATPVVLWGGWPFFQRGWASIVNRTGTTFDDAKVSLVAGELHRAGETPDRGPAAEEAAPQAQASAGQDLFAYHLYPVSGTMDVRHLETTQVPIVGPARVAARRKYEYDGARDGSRVRVMLELGNEKAQGLGLPLPEGRVRVYENDPSGARTLVGEDAIAHTAAGEKLEIRSGTAFDLVGDRTRVSHTRASRNVTEDAYAITLRNHGRSTAYVTVVETLYGNWEITAKSSGHGLIPTPSRNRPPLMTAMLAACFATRTAGRIASFNTNVVKRSRVSIGARLLRPDEIGVEAEGVLLRYVRGQARARRAAAGYGHRRCGAQRQE